MYCDRTVRYVQMTCRMHDHTSVRALQRFHLYRIESTSSPCAFSFAVMENAVSSELQSAAAARQNQTLHGNECISSAATSPLILLFMQWSHTTGLLGKMNTYLCL